MSAGGAGDVRFDGGAEQAAEAAAAAAAAARHPPPAQLRVAPVSRGSRLARMSSRRETAAVAAPLAQRAPPRQRRGLRTGTAAIARGEASSSAAAVDTEDQTRQWMRAQRKKQPARRPQRLRTLKLKTQVHPDALTPYLYGDRGSPINLIVNETGCLIHYCALPPDEVDDQSAAMQGRPHTMTFVMSADTTEMLEEGSRRLRMLVNRVQMHVQRRTKAQNIYERQERQGANAAEEEADAAMSAEQQSSGMHSLGRGSRILDFQGQQHTSSSTRLPDDHTNDRKRRVGPPDTNRSRVMQGAYIPTARFPVRARVGAGDRFTHTDNGEPYREVWTHPEPTIYYRMDEPAQLPPQQHRYPDAADVDQHEMKSAPHAPNSSARPIKSAGESILGAEDDGIRPYIRRRLHASSDKTRQAFIPPPPRLGNPYNDHGYQREVMHRGLKRPARSQSSSRSDQDTFLEMQRLRGSNGSDQQTADEAVSPPDDGPGENDDVDAAMPAQLGSLELDEDVDEDWVTTSPVRRQYHRPIRGYYVRTLDGFMEPIAPPAAAYYYAQPQTLYGDYIEYSDSTEWISDEGEGMHAYEYLPPRGHFPMRELPVNPRERRQFGRPGLSGGVRMWSMADRAPMILPKRRKVSFGDLREQGYQAESDSAPDEQPAVADVPHSDEEPQSDSVRPSEFGSVPFAEVSSSTLEATSAGEERDAQNTTPVSECEENESGIHNAAQVPIEQSSPVAMENNGKDANYGADKQARPVEDESTVPPPSTVSFEQAEDQSKESYILPVLQNAGGAISDTQMVPAPSRSTDEVATGHHEDESNDVVGINVSNILPEERALSQDEALDGMLSKSSAIQKAVETDGGSIESTASNAKNVPDKPSAASEAAATFEPVVANGIHASPTDHRSVIVSSSRQVTTPITASMTMNDRLAQSLENMNRCEVDLIRVKEELTFQKEQYFTLRKEEYHRQCLQVLLRELVDLQCRLASSDALGFGSTKYEMLTAIRMLLESTASSGESVASKLEALRKGIDTIAPVQTKTDVNSSRNKTNEVDVEKSQAREELSDDGSCTKPPSGDHELARDEDERMDGAVATPRSPAVNSSPDEAGSNVDHELDTVFVSNTSVADGVVKLERNLDRVVIKQEEEPLLDCPPELPHFLWTFLTQSLTSDASQSSYVTRVMYKRLLEEIAKSNPYYYLHRNLLRPRPDRAPGSTPCEFGCRGASATKWERKLISQINSRMKSFDSAAYSLARSAGGKDALSRKKLNSVIRKVHLVAMQVHSLLSHLYCLKQHVVCSEADAMASALNNSHFEKRMGVYKSRLRLVFPHKQQSMATSASKEPEDLVRDTFEFFPELLVCVDIWGYNYREALVKHQRLRDTIILTADGVPSAPRRDGSEKHADAAALLPQTFFRSVEDKAFDFGKDANGRLRRMCDELLNLVCLWNDFKWMENLEEVELERIVAFEKGVGGSVATILGLYAQHLQALWAAHLRSEPEYLRSVRLTQHNAYYTPRSHVPVPLPMPSTSSSPDGITDLCSSVEVLPVDDVSACTASPSPIVDPDPAEEPKISAREGEEVDNDADNQGARTSDQRVAEAYWTRKRVDGAAQERVGCELIAPIEPDELARWDEAALALHLLDGDTADTLRAGMHELSAVAGELLRVRGPAAARYGIVGADMREADEAWSLSDQSGMDGEDAAAGAGGLLLDEDEDQPARDVTEVLAGARRRLRALTRQRARSARVREKLQAHAAELAREAVELVRNTAHMYT